MDMVYHRWIDSDVQQKGAYLNNGHKWVSATYYTPPFHIAADGHGDLGARFVDLNNDGRMDMVFPNVGSVAAPDKKERISTTGMDGRLFQPLFLHFTSLLTVMVTLELVLLM